MSMRETPRASATRGLMGFARGVVKAVSSRAGQAKLQHLDVDALAGESHEGAEHMEGYGLTARPQAGAEAVIAYVGGNRAHPIVIAVANRQYRLQGLADGEVALYDDLGQKVHLTRDGIVVSAPTIRLVGNVEIVGDSLTHNGRNIGEDHRHSGVTAGADESGEPL